MGAVVLLLIGVLLQPGLDASSGTEPDATPVRAKRRAERVMNAGLPLAEKMLAENREFVPFGAVMLPEGLIQVLGTDRQHEQESIEEIYDKLLTGLQEGAAAGTYETVATFVLVDMRHPVRDEVITAVRAAIEHRDGYCVDVYYPVVLRDEVQQLGEAFAGARRGTFFDTCN